MTKPFGSSRALRGRLALVLALAAVLAALTLPVSAWAGTSHTAYVANSGAASVTPIDTATNTPGTAFGPFGDRPSGIAITPDGTTAYLTATNLGNPSRVTPIDTATNTAGTPITVSESAWAIAITPDGATAYVAHASSSGHVTPIDIATNTAGAPITVGSSGHSAIAITPDGATAYVASSSGKVTPIDTATNGVGTPIAVGDFPEGIAITPDGATAYVANFGGNFGPSTANVTPIDTATGTTGTPIVVDGKPRAIAITPDGATAYVASFNSIDFGTVTPIDTATNTPGTAITVGGIPRAIAITPDGATAYVANSGDGTVTPIDTATNGAGTPIAVGIGPSGIAITPDQPPSAAFTASHATIGQATSFDGSGSSASPGHTVASYNWDFGDGSTATTATATTSHTYAAVPGTYTATLTVTDDVGCSTERIFTGQTMSCNGSSVARVSHQVAVGATPTLSTAASPDIILGGTVHDTATLAGGANPTGAITFKLYGPDDASCSGPAAFTDTVSVSGNGDYPSANHPPTQAGTYRWTADYSGDTANNPASSPCNAANQSVTVSKVTPTLSTAASPDIVLGGTVHDTATLAAGASPSGTITFNLYGPDDASCSGAAAFTNTVPVSGNGDYPSATYTPTQAGTYRWTADYSGDANNLAASSACNAANESVTVSPVTPTLSTTASADIVLGGTVHDTATLAGGASPTGTITFNLYGPDDASCSGAAAFTDTVSVSGNGDYPSATYSPTQAGTYRWTADYSGDANNLAASSACNDPGESSLVSPSPPVLPGPSGGGPTEFSFEGLRRKTKKGNAVLTVIVPGPGEIGYRGQGEGARSSRAVVSRQVSGGRVRLKIKSGRFGKRSDRIRRKLKRGNGRAKVKIFVTYAPVGGTAITKPYKLRLVRK